MHFIFVSGACTQQNSPLWNHFLAGFGLYYPDAHFLVAEAAHCLPWDLCRVHALIAAIVEKIDTGDEVTLGGHSLGGIAALAVAKKLKRSKVRCVFTICSPHLYLGGYYPLVLDATDVRAPLISYGATRDEVLWWEWGTKHPQSKAHRTLDSDHYDDFVNDARLAQGIVDDVRNVLAGT